MDKMINQDIVYFKTEQEIKEWANTTHLVKDGNIIQVFHFRKEVYCYLVECTQGWNELEMVSINPIYGKGE